MPYSLFRRFVLKKMSSLCLGLTFSFDFYGINNKEDCPKKRFLGPLLTAYI